MDLRLGAAALLVWVVACKGESSGPPPYVDARAPCAQRDPLRRALFGDLHVHTRNSFDAWVFDVRTTPEDAYRFAQGAPLTLFEGSEAARTVQLDRPLDFAAVTDHAEYLGEVSLCTTPGSEVYESATCRGYRAANDDTVVRFGLALTEDPPHRFSDVCGADGRGCLDVADGVWGRIQAAADEAYDRSAACRFTAFVGYEWTAVTAASNLHRNVIFRTGVVPPAPASYFEFPKLERFHQVLRSSCQDSLPGCDVLAIPHNANWSNGNMFFVEAVEGDLAQAKARAEARAALEPLLEVFQHKGDGECSEGLSGVSGAPDEQCDFEKLRRDFPDCGDGTGFGGVGGVGCVSRLDFLRGVLLKGFEEERRLGVNPYAFGVIASTDTHNGTPGYTREDDYVGHWGNNEDTDARRLGRGTITPAGIIFNGGGLVGVWAEENSREAIFDALKRKETFGTSGPRITVRMFAGWDLPQELCQAPDLVAQADARGVAMGRDLGPRPSGASPRLVVSALQDPGTEARPGTPLQVLQVVKGWLDPAGQAHLRVFDVAGDAANGASVDLDTCAPRGAGASSLCVVWTDPEFDPAAHAFYYVRVLENPTCRWSTWQCNRTAPAARPETCSDPAVPKLIQERAWSSPVFYRP
jgi:hypothetical protein